MTLSVVLPCFNEEGNIERTVREVVAWMEGRGLEGEIIVVNDGSRDATGEILERLQHDLSPQSSPLGRGRPLHVLTHPINLGYGAAVRAGCDAARTEWIGFMDSDGQFDPRDFDRLLSFLNTTLTPVPSPFAKGEGGAGASLPLGGRVTRPIRTIGSFGRGERGSMNSSTPSPVSSPFRRERGFDVVVGRRRKRADSFLRKVNAKLFGLLSLGVLGIWVRDVNCAMKVFRRSVWERARPVVTTGALFNAEFFYNLKRAGIPWHQVDVAHYPRRAGKQTGANLRVILRVLRELLTLKRGS